MINYKGLFKILYKMPESGVIAFRNNEMKIIYITQSKNIKPLISKILVEIKNKIFKHRELVKSGENTEILFLQDCKDAETRKLHIQYWIDYFENQGFTVLKDKSPLEYRVRVRLGSRYEQIFVELLNKRREIKVVGVFKSIIEAEDFVEKCYKINKYKLPVYSFNNLTKEYLKEQDKDINE